MSYSACFYADKLHVLPGLNKYPLFAHVHNDCNTDSWGQGYKRALFPWFT